MRTIPLLVVRTLDVARRLGLGAALTTVAWAEPAVLKIDFTQPGHVISPRLMGVNTVFSRDSADKFAAPGLLDTLERARIRVMRYPGGEVTSFYHRDFLQYPGWTDAWQTDPKGKSYLAPEAAARNTNNLSLDQFIALCRRLGATPLVGINIASGIRFNREPDGLAEAAATVRYCLQQGYEVQHWFISNESYLPQSAVQLSVTDYAARVNAYAGCIRAIQPDAKIIVNWHPRVGTAEGWKEYSQLLAIAGRNIDYCDAHWYWRHGRATFAAWLAQTPIQLARPQSDPETTPQTYSSVIREFKRRAREAGFPNLKLASLEWNVGPAPAAEAPTAYECLLMQSEMMMQFMAGGLDLACLWPLNWPAGNKNARGTISGPRALVDPESLAPRPNIEAFHLLTEAGGLRAVPCEAGDPRVVAFAAVSPDSRTGWIALLNKNPAPAGVDLKIETPFKRSGWDHRVVEKIDDEHVRVIVAGEPPMAARPASSGLGVHLPPLSFSVVRLFDTTGPDR